MSTKKNVPVKKVTPKKVAPKKETKKEVEMINIEVRPLTIAAANDLALATLTLSQCIDEGKLKEVTLDFNQSFGKVNLTLK